MSIYMAHCHSETCNDALVISKCVIFIIVHHYVKAMFALSYSENSHELASESNIL